MKKLLFCTSLLLFLFGIVPYLWASLYVIPAIDDLTNASSIRAFSNDGFILGAIKYAINIYIGWQGTYSSNIIISFFRPYEFWGVQGLRIYTFLLIILVVVAFVVSVFEVLSVYIHDISLSIISSLVIGLYILFVSFNMNTNLEFLYFNTSTYVYTIPLVFGFLSISLFCRELLSSNNILAKYDNNFMSLKLNKVRFVIIAVFGVIACGGSLQISAIMCCLSLVFAIISIKRIHSIKSIETVYFLILFILSCVNAFAPGGFVRAGSGNIMGVSKVIRALFNSFYDVILELRHIVLDTYFVFYIILFFIALCFIKVKYVDLRLNVLYTVIAIFFVAIISIFPVVFGHNSQYIDARNTIVLDMVIVIGALIVTWEVYNKLLKNKVSFQNEYLSLLAIVVFIGILCFNQGYDYSEQPSFLAYHQLINGKVQQYSEDMDVVLNYFANSSGDVYSPHVHCEQGVIYKLEFQENPEYWVNKGTADYFGLNSIKLDASLEVNDLRQMGY